MAAASIPHQWTYNVFVSFRGEDIRKSFIDHLFRDFRQKGIYAFNDNNHLPRGEEISSQLYKGIEESRFLIVIFSKNYASSSWCLRELVKIIECQKIREHRHEVRIIFYDVKPDVVRKQTESYAEAFAKHEVLNRTEVAKWKESLSTAANLSGWDLQDMTNGYESKFIGDISKELLEKLCDGPLHVGDNLVGMDARVNKMNLLRFVESNNVHMIGICGISGIGKTTLAKAIYNLTYVHFEECSFFYDVQGATKRHGLTQVVKQLIDDIMKTRDVKISNIGQGIMALKQRMGSRRILLVLDGVDHHMQLEVLAGSSDWFLPGSLIIFTSQDKQLLRSHRVEEIFDMEFLDDVEALTLFSSYAFSQNHPTKDFGELAYRVVQYVQGHPLALKLLGQFLYGKTAPVWKSELDRLQIYPNMEIQQVLRLTFDGLDFEQQKMLLDIACYLVGENKDLAASVLDSCDFFAHTNMQVLLDKSLITISSAMTLQMHDLIQRMARGIVREESERPGNRSRLWIQPEVCDVLNKDKVTEAVEVLVLSLQKSAKKVNIDGKSFARMNNLRIIKIYDLEVENSEHTFKLNPPWDSKVNLSGLEFLSNELRMLCWHGYPSKFLPSNFYPENIVSVDMSYSHIKSLWTAPKCFPRLKQMKLKHCHNLTTTPDFTEIKNLEKLILEGCLNLAIVHPSIGMLNRLLVLNMRNCVSLKSFPSNIEMNSLEVLNLSGCSKVEKLPNVLGTIKTLMELHVDQTAIREVPLFVYSSSNLQVLSIGKCVEIQSRWRALVFGSSYVLHKLHPPQSLVLHSFASLCLLKHLDVSHCNLSAVSPDIGVLSRLEYLNLSGNNFASLPASFSELSRLKSLGLNDCNKLEVLPELSPTIKFIYASRCASLEGLGNLPIMHNNFYQYLFLIGCPKLVGNLKSLMSMLLPQGLNYICGRLDIMFYRKRTPQWFTYRSMGNCVNVRLPPAGWCYNKFRGYGTCVVFTHKKSHGRTGNSSQPRYFVNNFDGTCLDDASMLKFDVGIMESMVESNCSHVTWLHYSKGKPSWKEAKNYVTFSFKNNDDVEVKECGVRLIFECDEDIQEEDVDLLQSPGQDGGVFHVNLELSSESIEDERPFREKRIMWSTK